MPVVHKTSGEISIPSSSNRDLGIFLLFAGLAVSFPVKALVSRVLIEADWPGLMGPLGFLLASWGLVLLRFTRKRFRLIPKGIAIQDGWVVRPMTYHWEEDPVIRLRPQEEERGRGVVEVWLVNLIDGKRQYVLDRREGNQIESRSLAEALAKSLNCPLLEACEGKELRLERDELDLPFRERVQRHPELLGNLESRPEGCSIQDKQEGLERIFHWRFLNSATFNDFFSLACVVILLGVVPLFSQVQPGSGEIERFQLSFLDLARQKGQFLYFVVSGTLLVLHGVCLFGYSKELRVGPEGVRARDSLWGVPCYSASIRTQELEEIWVRQSSRGAHLQLISDARIISGRTSNSQVASWLASQIRHYYGGEVSHGTDS